LPTFQPTIKDFGLDAGTINWKKSQIRTFQYAPWNFKRQASDADRCGIEKGSVIAIEQMQGALKPYVGSYQNEGFGKIIVNPDFLETDPQTNGESKFKFEKKQLLFLLTRLLSLKMFKITRYFFTSTVKSEKTD
jgi:hypothetical protein